ncbi:MAG: hypothetical protein Q9187_007945 [Circinaria calcarea]
MTNQRTPLGQVRSNVGITEDAPRPSCDSLRAVRVHDAKPQVDDRCTVAPNNTPSEGPSLARFTDPEYPIAINSDSINEYGMTPDVLNPPSYSEVTYDFTVMMSALQAERVVPDGPSPDETERFRNFLIHCLAKDYKLDPIPPLNPDDTTHYLRMGEYFLDAMTPPDWYLHAGEEHYRLFTFMDAFFYKPTRALDLPVDRVLVMLMRFRRTSGYRKFEKGHWYGLGGYLEGLALKLFVDRSIMINAIVPPTNSNLRRKLLDALDSEQAIYFTSLASPESFTLTERGTKYRDIRSKSHQFRNFFKSFSLKECHKIFCEIATIVRFKSIVSKRENQQIRNDLIKQLEDMNKFEDDRDTAKGPVKAPKKRDTTY